jgi:hypothetical protein
MAGWAACIGATMSVPDANKKVATSKTRLLHIAALAQMQVVEGNLQAKKVKQNL